MRGAATQAMHRYRQEGATKQMPVSATPTGLWLAKRRFGKGQFLGSEEM